MSFAPIRPNNSCKWYVDGEEYLSDVCDELLKAKHQVYITDWWMSPQLYLKRPVGPKYNQDNRLDRVLLLLAQKGVKVTVIVYNEPTIALSLNSEYTQKVLSTMHPNILVIRHPPFILPTFLWSHHEKIVIID